MKGIRWFWTNWRSLWSADLGCGVLAAAGVGVATGRWPECRDQATNFFVGGAALGTALLALALAALAILVGLLDEEYLFVLRQAHDEGVRTAFLPYRIVAVVSALSLAVSLAGLLVEPVANWWVVAGMVAAAALFGVWAAVGTVQLVTITSRHGMFKARVSDIREQLRERQTIAREASERSRR